MYMASIPSFLPRLVALDLFGRPGARDRILERRLYQMRSRPRIVICRCDLFGANFIPERERRPTNSRPGTGETAHLNLLVFSHMR